MTAPGLDQQLGHYVALTAQVLEQTRRRVVLGESVPNAEKVFCIVEPHTELINRGKTPQPVEFGHRVVESSKISWVSLCITRCWTTACRTRMWRYPH